MRALLLFLCISLSLSGCRSKNNSAEGSNQAIDTLKEDGTHVTVDTSKPTGNPQRTKPKPVFNLTSFVKAADSLVSVMAGEPVRFRYVITNKLDTTKGNFTMLRPSEAEKIQHYRLIANKGNGKWDIGILRMTYPVNSDLDRAYADAAKTRLTRKTKSNDCVLKASGEFAWLYTDCAFSDTRFNELRQSFENALQAGDINAGTICSCSESCRPLVFK